MSPARRRTLRSGPAEHLRSCKRGASSWVRGFPLIIRGWIIRGWIIRGWIIRGWIIRGWIIRGWIIRGGVGWACRPDLDRSDHRSEETPLAAEHLARLTNQYLGQKR